MSRIDRSALLPHSAEKLFNLVADIERYPSFLNGCVTAEVLAQQPRQAGHPEIVTARLGLSRVGLSHSFVTRNTMTPHECITLALVDGPFEYFDGQWVFKALAPDACKVALTLNFRLRSGLINAAAGKLFDRVALDLVDSVVARAGTIYGESLA